MSGSSRLGTFVVVAHRGPHPCGDSGWFTGLVTTELSLEITAAACDNYDIVWMGGKISNASKLNLVAVSRETAAIITR